MENNKVEKKLDVVIALLSHIIAVELYRGGATQDDICKNLHIHKTNVGKMLKGIKKDK